VWYITTGSRGWQIPAVAIGTRELPEEDF